MLLKPLTTERELLQQVAAGDQRAFRLLYESYYRKIFTQAMHLLHSETLAEEIMQEVFLKVWRLEDGLLQIASLDAYLKVLTRNLCLDTLRKLAREAKGARHLRLVYNEEHNETEESIILNDTRKVLADAIALLPKQQREVYQLCHQEGLKYEEAAERLNLSPLTVQTHMKRALRSLRGYIQSHTDVAALLIVLKLF